MWTRKVDLSMKVIMCCGSIISMPAMLTLYCIRGCIVCSEDAFVTKNKVLQSLIRVVLSQIAYTHRMRDYSMKCFKVGLP